MLKSTDEMGGRSVLVLPSELTGVVIAKCQYMLLVAIVLSMLASCSSNGNPYDRFTAPPDIGFPDFHRVFSSSPLGNFEEKMRSHFRNNTRPGKLDRLYEIIEKMGFSCNRQSAFCLTSIVHEFYRGEENHKIDSYFFLVIFEESGDDFWPHLVIYKQAAKIGRATGELQE